MRVNRSRSMTGGRAVDFLMSIFQSDGAKDAPRLMPKPVGRTP
jgi:hypothetical protein